MIKLIADMGDSTPVLLLGLERENTEGAVALQDPQLVANKIEANFENVDAMRDRRSR